MAGSAEYLHTAMNPEIPVEGSLSWGLVDDELEIEFLLRERSDILVRARELCDDSVVWEDIVEYGFWDSRTKRGEIKNNIAAHSRYDKSVVQSDLHDIWPEFLEDEELRRELLSTSVKNLIENTVRVEVHRDKGNELHIYIEAEPNGTPAGGSSPLEEPRMKKLVFTNSEWVRNTGDYKHPLLVDRYSNAFNETLHVTWRHWTDVIRPAWADMQIIVEDAV